VNGSGSSFVVGSDDADFLGWSGPDGGAVKLTTTFEGFEDRELRPVAHVFSEPENLNDRDTFFRLPCRGI
jgi:hypothetical protein